LGSLLLQLLIGIALYALGTFDVALADERFELVSGSDFGRANYRGDSAHRGMGFGKLGLELIAFGGERGVIGLCLARLCDESRLRLPGGSATSGL
jgi:hypothetical protein